MTKVYNVKHTKFNNDYTKQKGFTIVELVIVIAVIGILAAVLIPTFNSIINKANENKARQEITNVIKEYTTIDPNLDLDSVVITYLDESSLTESSFTLLYLYGYSNRSLIELSYESVNFSEGFISVDEAIYKELDITSLNNIPEYIKLYKLDENFIKYSVKVINEDYEVFFTKEGKDLLEGKYLPGDRIVISPKYLVASRIGIIINGEKVKELSEYDNPYKYEFTMPNYDVEIELKIVKYGTGEIVENEISFSYIYPFIDDIDPNDVTDIYYISNQSFYNLSNDYSRCIYISGQTNKGKESISEIINKLKALSYELVEEYSPLETGLPREKYFILTDDKTYEFYYDEYISYNGKYYENENFVNLFGENGNDAYTFIDNYMPSTQYLTPIYYNGEMSQDNIDLRRFIFEVFEFGCVPESLPFYDESTHVSFKALYGIEGDMGTFTIESSKMFSSHSVYYEIINDFTLDEYKNTCTITILLEDFENFEVIVDKGTVISEEYLEQFIDFDNNWMLANEYIFSNTSQNAIDIFKDGNIVVDSNKLFYYTKDDSKITLGEKYPFINDLELSDIKNIYIVSNDSLVNGTMLSSCKYIENNEESKEFLETFITSLKEDEYINTKGVIQRSEDAYPEKYIINTSDNVYEFRYESSIKHNDITYMKETDKVNFPEDLYNTYYTLVKNDMTEEDYILPVNKNYPDGSYSGVDDYFEVVDMNTDREDKVIDIRKFVFEENIADGIEDGPKYIDTYFNVNILNCKILYDDLIKCTIGNKVKYYEIVSDFTFRDYLDEVSFRIMKEGIPGAYTPRFSNKEIILERGTELSKDDVIGMLDIRYFDTPDKYYIKIYKDFGESGYITLDKNSIIGVLADFGYEIKILDEQNLYVKEEVANEWNGIFQYGKYKLELIPKKDKYVRVLINNEIVKTIKPSSYVAEYLEFTLDEDIVISFEEVSSLEELIPNELYYKDMYPFISDIDVEDIKEIIKIDPINSTLYNGASFITIDSDETRSYAFEFLRFFREEKCSITDTSETLNTSKYVIVTNDGIYKIEDVNVFERTGKTYKSNTLAAFPDLYVTEGLTIKYMQYIIKGNTIATFDVDKVVFNQVTNVSKIYGYTSEIRLDGGYGSWIDPYYSVYSSKDVVYNDGEGNKEYLKVVNSYSFEEYFTSCINMEFSIDIYRNDANQNKYKMCTVIYKAGDVVTKESLTKLLSAYGCNSSTIYSTYDVTNNLVMEELFIENEEITVEDNMSIYITKEIY